MEILVSFTEEPKVKDSLYVSKKLGSGKFSVYEAHSPKHNKNFALKVFPNNESGTIQYQKEKLILKLSHPNIIQSIPISCHRNDFWALLTEQATYGDFFELVTSGALNNEVLVRSYFHQLIAGIEYIHFQGIAHLDLKLENLMLGADLKLKIIDFDQAQLLTDPLITSGGSPGYRAPEVSVGTCSNFVVADIYSAGILLYAFKANQFPFKEKTDQTCQDPRCYSTFVKNNTYFWQKKIELLKDQNSFSFAFIELVNGMLHPRASKRLSIEQIKASAWYQGPVLDEETLRSKMMRRLEKLKNINKKPSLVQLPKISIKNK